MRLKTIFVIVVTVLATIVLMKNTDEVTFWVFGERYISKLAILGIMFVLGFIVGVVVARPRKKPHAEELDLQKNYEEEKTDFLSDEDKEYIS